MTRRLLAAAAVLMLLAACGGGDDESDTADATTTTTASPAQASADITAMWTSYFKAGNPVDDAVASLENGATYRDAIIQQQQSGATNGLSVVVKDVQVINPKLGQVTYDIVINGNVALANSKGNAVFVDGKWKVSEQHFCVLLSLGGINPPACEKVLNP
jgi:ABC-type glycerol-3-phosphate transport system substrate-binding protein